MLDWSKPTGELIWHVIYGNSQYDAKLKVAVNANSAENLSGWKNKKVET